jgi:hypothetical protein
VTREELNSSKRYRLRCSSRMKNGRTNNSASTIKEVIASVSFNQLPLSIPVLPTKRRSSRSTGLFLGKTYYGALKRMMRAKARTGGNQSGLICVTGLPDRRAPRMMPDQAW